MNKETQDTEEKRTDQIKHNQARLDEVLLENDKLKQEVQDLKNNLKEVRTEAREAKKSVREQVLRRIELLNKVAPYVESITSIHHLSDRAIMEITMRSINNDQEDFSSYSDDTVKGIFFQFIKNHERQLIHDEAAKRDAEIERKTSGNNDHDPRKKMSIHEIIAEKSKADFYSKF